MLSIRVEWTIMILIATTLAVLVAWLVSLSGVNDLTGLIITIVTVMLLTYLFSLGLTIPLTKMRDAAQKMAEGDYKVRVDVSPHKRDEIGQLAASFNEMAQELEHADQMRRDMVANVSHELRTPVSALQAMVENMADGVVPPNQSNLESILRQTHRLSDLIAFLLDLSRMEAGVASLDVERFNFSQFIDETVEPLEIADGSHNHTIELKIPDSISMEGDQDRLRQLFTNIIANALKHSPDNTAVLVEARQDNERDAIVTHVVNFGSHIPKEIRNDIFRRFVKGKTGPGTESGGTGLGLSIARWAAQLHGGTVQVVDDPRGADFEIVLPKHHPFNEQSTAGDEDSEN